MTLNGITRRTTLAGVAAGLIPVMSRPSSATSAHGKQRHLVLADEEYGFRATASAAANTAALQAAVNQAQIIQLPVSSDPITFNGPVNLPLNTRILGRGSSTRLVSTGHTAFVCEASDGSGGDAQAPWLEDFELFCAGNGIRFNSASGGFSDAAGQPPLMRPRLDRVRIRRASAGNGGSTGIEFNKCFDGLIQQCEIQGFDKGYVGRGSDVIEINGRTRISACNTLIELIQIPNSTYRFGSGTRIIGCDLLAARDCYVRSSDLDLLVEGSYFEHNAAAGALTGWAFDLKVLNRVRFIGNRMELTGTSGTASPAPAVPRFLNVTTEPGNLFVWEDNGNDGSAFGEVRWNAGGGQRYWLNDSQRSRIIQRGTSGVAPLPLPFNSTDVAQDLPWRFSPSLPGLRHDSLGASVRCIDDAFVIPPAASDQGISFQSGSAPITGKVDIWIRAKADTAGHEATLYLTNDGRYVEKAVQPLGRNHAWYRMFSNVNVTNLVPMVLNKNTSRSGNIHLGELVITAV